MKKIFLYLGIGTFISFPTISTIACGEYLMSFNLVDYKDKLEDIVNLERMKNKRWEIGVLQEKIRNSFNDQNIEVSAINYTYSSAPGTEHIDKYNIKGVPNKKENQYYGSVEINHKWNELIDTTQSIENIKEDIQNQIDELKRTKNMRPVLFMFYFRNWIRDNFGEYFLLEKDDANYPNKIENLKVIANGSINNNGKYYGSINFGTIEFQKK